MRIAQLSRIAALTLLVLLMTFNAIAQGSEDKDGYAKLIKAAQKYESLGETQKALDTYLSASALRPEAPEPWVKMSILYILLKKPDEAREAADKAVQTGPEHSEAWLNKSVVLLASGQFKDALETTRQALKKFPDDIRLINNMASAQLYLKKNKDAEKTLLRALKLNPANGTTNYNLACVYAMSNMPTTSLEYLKKAISINGKYKTRAINDPDLTPLRDLPQFRKLTKP